MRFKWEGQVVQIRFRYQRNGVGGIETTCLLQCGEKVLAVGMATQNPKDQMNKETGRKLSLVRAINVWDATANVYGRTCDKVRLRRLIWHAYHARHNRDSRKVWVIEESAWGLVR